MSLKKHYKLLADPQQMAAVWGSNADYALRIVRDLRELCSADSGLKQLHGNFQATPREYSYPQYGNYGMAVSITGNVLRLEYAITHEKDGAVRVWPSEFSLACQGNVRAQALSSATEERAQLQTLHEKIAAYAEQRGAIKVDASPIRGSRWILPVKSI